MDSQNKTVVKRYKGAALVIGVDDYDQLSKLDNAVFDAKAISDKLKDLNFITTESYDETILGSLQEKIDNYVESLVGYDVSLVYFSGHGIEIEGKNYLVCKEAPSDNANSLKRLSIDLQDLIDRIHSKDTSINIFIVDACRNNPFPNDKFRGSLTQNLAPVNAPQGTLIAYSTSPGQTAKDGGFGQNSIYTGALLKHLDEKGIEVEQFFKKVRTTVHELSKHTQTSWEHTSLIGRFSLNDGQIIQNTDLGYSNCAIADLNWSVQKDSIIERLKTHNYDSQNAAARELKNINPKDFNKDELFVIGRNILQSAFGGSFECQNFLQDKTAINRFTVKENNHLLNGILFEAYFDCNGHFRYENFKTEALSDISVNCQGSVDFINKALNNFKNNLIYHPLSNEQKFYFQLITEEKETGMFTINYVTAFSFDGINLLANKSSDSIADCHAITYKEDLIRLISRVYGVPSKKIEINHNVSNLVNLQFTHGVIRYNSK